ncbi:MAG: sensor diguanylate cyclase [Firmicutes bacterium]|nr:sensor diguanylate cyclase [Bacillota bacterium]
MCRNRYRRSLALLTLDIDYLKCYNDTHGHILGNDVLSKVAEALKVSCRDVGIVARHGGEQFVVIISKANSEEIRVIAEAD